MSDVDTLPDHVQNLIEGIQFMQEICDQLETERDVAIKRADSLAFELEGAERVRHIDNAYLIKQRDELAEALAQALPYVEFDSIYSRLKAVYDKYREATKV